MKQRTAKKAETGDKCERCGSFNVTMLVDIHAVIKRLGCRMCTRCCNQILTRYPASSAVHIRRYE